MDCMLLKHIIQATPGIPVTPISYYSFSLYFQERSCLENYLESVDSSLDRNALGNIRRSHWIATVSLSNTDIHIIKCSKTQKYIIKEYSPYYSFVLDITQTNTKGNIIPNRFSLYKTIHSSNN